MNHISMGISYSDSNGKTDENQVEARGAGSIASHHEEVLAVVFQCVWK